MNSLLSCKKILCIQTIRYRFSNIFDVCFRNFGVLVQTSLFRLTVLLWNYPICRLKSLMSYLRIRQSLFTDVVLWLIFVVVHTSQIPLLWKHLLVWRCYLYYFGVKIGSWWKELFFHGLHILFRLHHPIGGENQIERAFKEFMEFLFQMLSAWRYKASSFLSFLKTWHHVFLSNLHFV